MKEFIFLISFCIFYFGVMGQEPRLVLPVGHTGRINSAVFSPNGRLVLTAASFDNSAKIWEVSTGRMLTELIGHSSGVLTAMFDPSGNRIVTASRDASAKIWDANNGNLLFTLFGHKKGLNSAVFSPDGKQILTAANDGTFKIWNTDNGKLIHDFNPDSSYYEINSAFYSPDGKKIVTHGGSSNDDEIRVWDIETSTQLTSFSSINRTTFSVFSTDGLSIISGNDYHSAEVNSVVNGELIETEDFNKNWIKSILYKTDGTYLLTLITDTSSRSVKTYEGKFNTENQVFNGWFHAPVYSPNYNYILTVSFDNNAKVWNTSDGSLYRNLTGHGIRFQNVFFDKNRKEIIAGSYDMIPTIWSVNELKLIKRMTDIHEYSLPLFQNNDNLYWIEDENTFQLVNFRLSDSNPIHKIEKKEKFSCLPIISDDGKFIVTAAKRGIVSIWDAKTGLLLKNIGTDFNQITSLKISRDGKKLIIANGYNSFSIWDIEKSSLICKINEEYKKNELTISDVVFILEDTRILIATGEGIYIGTSETGLILKKISNTKDIEELYYSSKNQKIITLGIGNSIGFINLKNNSRINVLKAHNDKINSLTFNLDESRFITGSSDNTFKIWDTETEKLIATTLIVDSIDYISQIPSGYYQCSPNAAKLLHYVTKDLKVITFEQLDVKYNRPDKVLEAIGNTDTSLINSYRKAYQKRIKKLGIDTTQFADGYSVPEADFVNRDNIDYEQSKDKLTLTIKANDSIYKLDRFNVWVNEVPVFGLRGIKVKRKNSFDTTVTITLSQGENRIEASVTNINGTESYKMPLFVKYTTAKPQPSKQHFIGIGINQFSNTDYNLNWSVKDIRDLAIKFKSKYPNIIIDTLFDKNVTKENILALKKKLLQLNEDDKVIISYSGHGVLSKDFDYFLSTYNINFAQPEENGLAYDDLESLLDNIKPRQKLLLIDACHSGEVDKDELLKIETAKTELNKNGVATKSTIKVVKKEKQLGLANSFELMQNLFVNVGKGTGATIISAAGGTQYAQERGDLKNGVFTYSIIEAMSTNSTLSVSQLKKLVGERVTQLTNGLQKPTSRNETNNYDWLVW